MKDPRELLNQKRREIAKLQEEAIALKTVIPMLIEETDVQVLDAMEILGELEKKGFS